MASSQAQAETRSAEMVEPVDFFQVGQDDGVQPRIYLRYDLFRAIEEFALKDTSRELAGLLLGRTAGNYTLVEEAVECGIEAGEGGGRFTSRVFQYARRIARHRYPELRVLGWFHTHPGSGLELSDEEREVHRAQFPDSGQLLYVEDPVQRDRNFHRNVGGGQVAACSGFRIYGKETFKELTQEATPVRADEHLKERYLERSLEKIQRQLRRPPWQLKDTLIIALLVANLLALVLLRPGPARVTVGGAPANDKQMKLLTEMSGRLTALEEHLQAMQVIDEELMTSPSPTATSTAPPPPPSSAPGKARSHKVRSGDTLGKIAEKYYGTTDPKVLKSLARVNGLKSPNYDLFLGETLKIPDKKDLK